MWKTSDVSQEKGISDYTMYNSWVSASSAQENMSQKAGKPSLEI